MRLLIFLSLLSACGTSNGGVGAGDSPATTTSTPTATTTSPAAPTPVQPAAATTTATATAVGTTPVSDIVATLALVVLGKGVADQPAAVQALFSANYTTIQTMTADGVVCKTGPLAASSVSYRSKPAFPYTDGTSTLTFAVYVGAEGALYVTYQVDAKPEVNRAYVCPKP